MVNQRPRHAAQFWRATAVAGLLVAGVVAPGAGGCAHRTGGPPNDPKGMRASYGAAAVGPAAALHLWWPLTAPEVAAVAGIPAARQGDYRALLALAILASGDVRDAEGVSRIQQRVDQFVAAVRPLIARAPDDWHRGYELHRAMHRTFFAAGGDLNGYDANQPRLTRIFASGQYNCLSSALLYVILARAFDLPVRGVSTPTHAFVELGPPGARPIEIETTSSLGFDLVHDRKFFAEQAAVWSAQRGLPPLSFEDYQRRQVMTPARLVAMAMLNQLPGASEEDQLRLSEMAAVVDTESAELQRNRLAIYAIEAGRLRDTSAWPTIIRFLDWVSPAVVDLRARLRDTESQRIGSWLHWYRGEALMKVGRQAEAMAVFESGVDRIDPTWQDAPQLRNNYWALFTQRLIALLEGKGFQDAEQLVLRHLEGCRADTTCAHNASVMYDSWAVDHYNAGNWPAAREVLQRCIVRLPEDASCRSRLTELESQHRF